MHYLKASDVLFIHSILIDETGGTHGIRDLGLLEAAVAQPRHSYEGRDLYPTRTDKAAALLSALAKNHPFVDGNKRTALAAAGVFLELNGTTLEAGEDALVEFVDKVAREKMNVPAVSRWIAKHIADK